MLMTDNKWKLFATTNTESYVAETNTDDSMIYRAISKWLVRGGASSILKSFWEYIDQYDNEIEDALLDQLVTQAETLPEDPQITNVRTKDYSIAMTVHAKTNTPDFKTCQVEFVLFVYFQSLKKKLRIDDQIINIILFRNSGPLEKVVVSSPTKTPGPNMKRKKRVSKRSSKVMHKRPSVS
jgi:hypothetical protein